MTTESTKALEQMTLDELDKLKRAQWLDAVTTGHIDDIGIALAVFGERRGERVGHNISLTIHGRHQDIKAYNDNDYLVVMQGGKVVMDGQREIYVPGHWQEIVSCLAATARKQQAERETENMERAWQDLIKQLTPPAPFVPDSMNQGARYGE